MSRRRRQQRLERVLGTPALFSTAYGNVGSSIYYALGVTAAFALGLTPVVFLNVVGIQESAKLNIFLALIDFATQLLLVLLGFALIFSPSTLVDNIHWGTAPTWSQFFIAIPVGMIAYTGIETVSNLSEETRDPVKSIPRSIGWVAVAVFAIYFTLPMIALSALPVHHVAGKETTLLALPPQQGGFQNDPVLGLVENLGISGAF